MVGGGAQLGVSFFYVVPVALATWWLDWRFGLGFAVGCLGLFAIGAAINPISQFGASMLVRAAVLVVVVAAVAWVRDRVLQLEGSAEELEAIRTALAPPAMPAHAGVEVAATFIPSELGVSGDFYLLTHSPDGSSVVVVGDVVGHGPKAARLATFIRARLATYAANNSDPVEILTLANEALFERPGRGELVSAICLRFHVPSRSFSWAVAGHPAPLGLPGLEALPSPEPTNLLGVEREISLGSAEGHLDPDKGVLLYTDGATDMQVEGGSMLGLEGLQSVVGVVAHLPAEELVGEVESALLDRAQGSIRDDICVLVLRPGGG